MPQSQKITFTTSDGVEIVGIYVDAGTSTPHALLLHMMPATKESYAAFAEKLRQIGISSLAIDFRGHGESVQKFTDVSLHSTVLDYQKFSDEEQQAKILDVHAAVEWLIQNHGAVKSHLVLVGASIGANLALQYLSENSEVPAAVLLSAGLDYRSVKTEPLVRAVKPSQSVYFAASSEDMRGSGQSATEMAKILFDACPCKKEIKTFDGAGHGTTMFEREPKFTDEVIKWIKERIE
ncbi:MAG: hypothetical protein UX17_C0005G0008 [Parcubacteria group bacterium GW2011_GWC2_45_7]|nr:MAG: hypothetical protein UX17_C0005G0008 [Parcubacteria group bacterium GW2011_GWC2_45_7]